MIYKLTFLEVAQARIFCIGVEDMTMLYPVIEKFLTDGVVLTKIEQIEEE